TFYNVISEAHTVVLHSGRDKTYLELSSQYS
ncbi:unnamed protein product, partial [Rotaria sp. Silwood1]